VITERTLIARYFHRFAFAPRPGEFVEAVNLGAKSALARILESQPNSKIVPPKFEALGPRPPAGIARSEWSLKMSAQRTDLVSWWLDQMASVDSPFIERMTWFWHGHWATSMSKVEYANSMYVQNQIFRNFAIGDFRLFAKKMILDGALQYWLDNQTNTVKAPNENLAREVMELFTLGVNRYSETDIKEVARALTGYSVDRESGEVQFNVTRHDNSRLNILNKSGNFDALNLMDLLVERDDCAQFIAERLWYRFVSDETQLTDRTIQDSFKERDLMKAILTLANHSGMTDEKNSMVKPPLEWFIGACRSLNVLPSKIAKSQIILGYLDRFAQKPFYPPNVGGWPSGEIWLTAANAQYRIEMAQLIVKAADLSAISNISLNKRASFLADLLGIGEWSARTKSALIASQTDPERMVTTALCAPEYIVSV
jgi:uncharacterized protein (DUF1800 family)